MQVMFEDRYGQRLRGKVLGSGQIGAAPVLVHLSVQKGAAM